VQSAEGTTGRYRQRRRTRAAITDATIELLRRGGPPPGVTEIAEAADVSRRTVYQYFPTVDQLLLDASLGLLTQTAVDSAIEAAGTDGGSARERVDAMIDALGGLTAQTLPLGRSIIRLTVDPPAGRQERPKRGYRRIEWIESAIEPLRTELDDDAFERLVSALALVIGWEALIVLEDLRGLGSSEQVTMSRWAARALIDSALAEARTAR
jgi:AcrR family transcriptional regulator